MFAFLMGWLPFTAFAVTVATADYVDAKSDTKVDTSANAVQTLKGDYTVSGSFTVTGAFKVPTPPLPNPDAD